MKHRHSQSSNFSPLLALTFIFYSLISISNCNSIIEFGTLTTDEAAWNSLSHCPNNSFVSGYSLRVNEKGSAVTAIRFFCSKKHSMSANHETHDVFDVEIEKDATGVWRKELHCDHGLANAFQVKLTTGNVSNDAEMGYASNMRLVCSNGEILQYSKQADDYWVDDIGKCHEKQAICGFQTPKLNSDETSPKAMRVACCDIPDRSLTCTPKKSWQILSHCENPISTTLKTCVYSRNVGLSYVPGKEHEVRIYEDLGLHLTSVGAHLQAKMSQVAIDGSNSTEVELDEINWLPEAEHEEFDEITAEPGIKTTIYQLVGHCGFYKIRFNSFTTVGIEMKENEKKYHKHSKKDLLHHKSVLMKKINKWLRKHKEEILNDEELMQGDEGWDDEEAWEEDDWGSEENEKKVESVEKVKPDQIANQKQEAKHESDEKDSWEDDSGEKEENKKKVDEHVVESKPQQQEVVKADQKKTESEENDSWGNDLDIASAEHVEKKKVDEAKAQEKGHHDAKPEVKEAPPNKKESEENDSWGDDDFEKSEEKQPVVQVEDTKNSVPVNPPPPAAETKQLDKTSVEDDSWGESSEEKHDIVKTAEKDVVVHQQQTIAQHKDSMEDDFDWKSAEKKEPEHAAHENHGDDIAKNHDFTVDIPLSKSEIPPPENLMKKPTDVDHVDIIDAGIPDKKAKLAHLKEEHSDDHMAQGDEDNDGWSDEFFDNDDSWMGEDEKQPEKQKEHENVHHDNGDSHSHHNKQMEHQHNHPSMDSVGKSVDQFFNNAKQSVDDLVSEGGKTIDEVKEMPIVKNIQDSLDDVKNAILQAPAEETNQNANNNDDHDHDHGHNGGDNDNEVTISSAQDTSPRQENKVSNAILGYIVGGMIVAVCIIVIIIFVLEKRKPAVGTRPSRESESLKRNELSEPPLLGGRDGEKRIAIEQDKESV